MKRRHLLLALLAGSTACAGLAGVAAWRASAARLDYGIWKRGALVGYLVVHERPGDAAAGVPARSEVELLMKLSALNQGFDVVVRERREADPLSGRLLSCVADVDIGTMKTGSSTVVEADRVHFTTRPDGKTAIVELDPDVRVDDGLRYPRLLGIADAQSRTLRYFEMVPGQIQERTCTRIGRETLRPAGRAREALVFEVDNHATGVTERLWVDASDGLLLKLASPDGTTIALADRWVSWRIGRASLDETLTHPVDVAIEKIDTISYMKLRATIRTAGEPVTAESLNVPGQRFDGSVRDNLVDGVFELELLRFDGLGAPPFPPDFSSKEELQRYLRPGFMIESDDPGVADQARELTRGASDSWDAARRLSHWVAKEIGYEIPGGSARHTLDTRRGECGSHARLLVALARAVGIPARLATGAIYFNDGGGRFGQHAWTELYMGETGWIPVDATLRETDFVDSGHLRLGSFASFVPESLEVLDYRTEGAGRGAGGDS